MKHQTAIRRWWSGKALLLQIATAILSAVVAIMVGAVITSLFQGYNIVESFLSLDTRLKFGVIPWIVFTYSYGLIIYSEGVHRLGIERSTTRHTYVATLYWGLFPVFFHFSPAFGPGLLTLGWYDALYQFATFDMLRLAQVAPLNMVIWTTILNWAGFILMVLGLLFCIVARVHLDGHWGLDLYEYKRTTARNGKILAKRNIAGVAVKDVVTSGPYAWVRHPIYAGQFGLVLGTFLLMRSPSFALFFGFAWYLNNSRAKAEEEHMSRVFTSDYSLYCSEVKHRYIPGIK